MHLPKRTTSAFYISHHQSKQWRTFRAKASYAEQQMCTISPRAPGVSGLCCDCQAAPPHPTSNWENMKIPKDSLKDWKIFHDSENQRRNHRGITCLSALGVLTNSHMRPFLHSLVWPTLTLSCTHTLIPDRVTMTRILWALTSAAASDGILFWIQSKGVRDTMENLCWHNSNSTWTGELMQIITLFVYCVHSACSSNYSCYKRRKKKTPFGLAKNCR